MEDMEEITLTGATEGDEASRREKFKGTAVYKALQKFEAREVAAHDVIAALQDESCLPDACLTVHLAAASDDAWARMVLSAEFFLKILQKDPAYEKKATTLEKFGALCETYIPRERNSTIEAMFAVVKKDFLLLREKLQNVTLKNTLCKVYHRHHLLREFSIPWQHCYLLVRVEGDMNRSLAMREWGETVWERQ